MIKLRSVYNCSKHPKVVAGEMTEDEVFAIFLKNYNDRGDGKIDKREWDDYYAAVSDAIDNDKHFDILMSQTWDI